MRLKPQRCNAFRKGWFEPAANEVGLDGMTPHELRHTAASFAVSAGAHLKSVQRMLGHASAAHDRMQARPPTQPSRSVPCATIADSYRRLIARGRLRGRAERPGHQL
ncbi:tyrosine-type recombinase/integrase [Lacisediminihabitans sp.]|uniref:tyrosine-type recombinase/integrase n=1 Tax=Lacisediminihabitans sp. TaxID=2787631 RepID=UPI00374D0DAB